MAETKLINFRYGTYDEIHGLGKDANCIYFASDKPLFYAVGKWHGIASMTSEVDRVNSKTILKINSDGGYAINCEIDGETLSKDLKDKLINAYEFVQLISGEDEDVIINKWNEIVAFLQGFGEKDKLLNVVVELQNGLADEIDNRISADLKHTEDIKSITDLVNDMFTLVDKGDGTKYIQSKYGFASDSFISARGVDNESSGVGGLDAQAVWDLLMQNDDATKVINVAHIPDITVAKITDFTTKVNSLIPTNVSAFANDAGYINTSHIVNKADKSTTLAGYGITDAVTLNTDQTITGAKTFRQVIIKAQSPSPLTLDNTDPNYPEIGVKFTLEGVAKAWVGYTENKGVYFYTYNASHRLGLKVDGTAYVDNNTIYHAGNLSPVTTDTDQTITGVKTFSNLRVNNSTMIANLNAEMVGGYLAGNLLTSHIANFDLNQKFPLKTKGPYLVRIQGGAAQSPNLPAGFHYGNLLHLEAYGSDNAFELLGDGYNKKLLYRSGATSVNYDNYLGNHSWKEIAFTDTNSLTPSGGTLNINGSLKVSNQITIGNATLYWDVANQCLRVNAGIASDSFLSAKGIDTTGNGQGGGGGFDAQMMWQELTMTSPTNTGKTIMLDLLPDMPTSKVTDFANQVKALITVENIPTLTSAKISDFNSAVATAMASTLSDISANLSNHEQRLQAIEQALTWQGVS